MNWDAIGATGEVLGAVAVFVTLMYLAIQVRHARDESRRALSQSRLEEGRAGMALMMGGSLPTRIKANDALGGAPGVHTKRWAMAHGGWERACLALCDQLGLVGSDASERARFACAIAIGRPASPDAWMALAEVHGRIRWPPAGEGPGFVPVFSADDGERFVVDGVLAHRRRAFERAWDAWRTGDAS